MQATPVLGKERIEILDSLRGIAVLGILLMNIPYFALPDPVQFYDLAVFNEMGTINQKVWLVITWILNGTQRALFALLFGAGIILFTQRLEQKISGSKSGDYFFRRQMWLMFFGLINFYVLLWIGDYLFPYACCAMLLYTFRNKSSKSLLIGAGVCLLLMVVRENVDLIRNKNIINRGEAVARLDTTTMKLSGEQVAELNAMKAFKNRASLENRVKIAENSLNEVRGNYNKLYKYQTSRGMDIFMYLAYYQIWSLLLFMFIGMAFYKNGILTGKASSTLYWLLFIIGLGGGLAISWYRIQLLIEHEFNSFEYTKNVLFNINEIGRVFRSLGIFGLIMLMYKSGFFKWLFSLMRPVGQMAFSNYLGQSFLMGIFFYGIGFGMFGKMQRYEIYYVVAITWVVQIIFSHIWLHYFQFGPLEWIWRQLTYWKRFPLRRPLPGES
ncbi:MAG: DUF418 domain-containing protein [Flavisolibacter sp.]